MSEGRDFSSQSHYQVRYDTGADGFARVAPAADVVVWVDALPSVSSDPRADPPAVPAAAPEGFAVVLADLTNASAVAGWLLERQAAKGDRLAIAIVASGNGVEDALAAGAVVDALTALGIDFASPEAALVCAGFASLRRAAAHLFSASVTGQALAVEGRADEVSVAAKLDSSTVVALGAGR